MADTEPQAPTYTKRRSNFVLRALIDEMLDQVRALDGRLATMSEAERAQAEQELDALMARVRRAAMKGPVA